jgi:endonuclease YncB( thermonuclease family)
MAIPLRHATCVALGTAALAGAARADELLPGPIPATVVRVVDGDTVEVSARIWLDQIVTVEVRLAGVNAPETYRPPCPAHREPGLAAAAFVTGLGLGEVQLFDVEHDKYGGRVVARVVAPDGVDVSEALLDAGHAWRYGDSDPLCVATAAAHD